MMDPPLRLFSNHPSGFITCIILGKGPSRLHRNGAVLFWRTRFAFGQGVAERQRND